MLRVYFHLLIFLVVLAAAKSQLSFVVTPKPSTDGSYPVNGGVGYPPPKIYEMHVTANVSNRFAHTLVTSRVKNLSPILQETQFSVVLPKTAYISEFVLETGGKQYKAIVMEKNDAERKYHMAKISGRSGAHVAPNARDSNCFDVTVSLEPFSKTTFFLTYEELLVRTNNQYEIILNIHPGQPVRHMVLQANIHESRLIKFVRTPTVQLTPEIGAPVARLERLWAYLTIKQILEAEVTATNRTVYEKAALDLALKYSFVTPVSSLVVEKPGWRGVVTPVAADAAFHRGKYGSRPSIPLTASHGLTVRRRSRASVSSASSNFQMLQLTFVVIVSVTIRYF